MPSSETIGRGLQTTLDQHGYSRVGASENPGAVHSRRHEPVLSIGAILVPRRHTVTSVLRITGRSQERHFVNFHRVLRRAAWSPRTRARILLRLLVDTVERRWGRRIRARGIPRDPVRSSDVYFVKTSGLRGMSLTVLVPIP